MSAFVQELPLPLHRVRIPTRGFDLPGSHEACRELLRERLSPIPAETGSLRSAVAALLFNSDGACGLLLTRRSRGLRAHPNEVSFPGGGLEEGEGILEGALREVSEEIGVDPSLVEPLGFLGVAATRSTKSTFGCVVGALDGPPVMVPNPAEVERVLVLPVTGAYMGTHLTGELWYLDREWRQLFFIDAGEDLVWGASAYLVVKLLALLQRAAT